MTTRYVDIWADVLCPFCYIAKRNYETALASFADRAGVVTRWHAFELDAAVSREPGPTLVELHHSIFGGTMAQARERIGALSDMAAAAGLSYDLERAYPVNSFDAHRLAKLGDANGVGDAVRERVMHAYTAEGAILSDPETLVRLAAEIGVDQGDVRAMLDSDDFGAAVREDETTAHRNGINGVPTFVVDGGDPVMGVRRPEEYHRMLAKLPPLPGESDGPGCRIDGPH